MNQMIFEKKVVFIYLKQVFKNCGFMRYTALFGFYKIALSVKFLVEPIGGTIVHFAIKA